MSAHDQAPLQALRAYAYLTASFRTQSKTADIIDCLTPFVSAAILKDATEPVDVKRVARNLADFGLDLPLYAIEQMLPRLQRDGVIEWNTVGHCHIPVPNIAQEKSQIPQLPEAFGSLEILISKYAERLGVEKPPLSETWADALISFLKERYAGGIKVFRSEGVISSATPEIQSVIVGLFIQDCASNNPEAFSNIERIFTGVQIEDFIQNVQSLGQSSDYSDLTILYDTSVLLRILGTSGKILQGATLEMHHTLQSLGAKTYYLNQNSNEVVNILGTLASAYDRGQEIYNETADALATNEITIGVIRDLGGTFESRLSALNIYPYVYDYNVRKQEEKFQIDELGFSEALKSAAIRRERIYSVQNALNDAGAVNLVIRLRKGRPAKDIGKSKVIFVSRNSLLQRVAREFAISNTDDYDVSAIPPVLTTGQITTAAWLAGSKSLEPSKLSQELLARCYAAVQPSSEWAEAFAAALQEFEAENPEVIADRANAIIFLQAARVAARETSFNDPALLKKANTVEIFRRAAEEAKAASEERDRLESERVDALQSQHRSDLIAAEEKWKTETQELSDRARIAGEQEALAASRLRVENRADRFARRSVRFLQLFAIAIFTYIIVAGPEFTSESKVLRVGAISLLISFTALAAADLVGIHIVKDLFDRVRKRLKSIYFSFLID